jgi:hypothetical protein
VTRAYKGIKRAGHGAAPSAADPSATPHAADGISAIAALERLQQLDRHVGRPLDDL